jgi:hypothetical protein
MTRHTETAYAVVMSNRMVAIYDKKALAVFSDLAAALAFKDVMEKRVVKCEVVKVEMTFSLPASPKKT